MAVVLLAASRCATAVWSTRKSIEMSRRIATDLSQLTFVRGQTVGVREWELMEVSLRRGSHFVPSTRCLQRAIAARIWLAIRGVTGQIHLGVRRAEGASQSEAPFQRGDPFRGHAWFEADETGDCLLAHSDVDYRIVYRG